MDLTEWCQEIWDDNYDFTHKIDIDSKHLKSVIKSYFDKKSGSNKLIFNGTGDSKGIEFRGKICSISTRGFTEFNGYFRIRFSSLRITKDGKNMEFGAEKVNLPWSRITTMNLPWSKDSDDASLVRFAVLIVGWNDNIGGSDDLGTFRCWPHDFIEHALSCFPYQGHMPDSKTR